MSEQDKAQDIKAQDIENTDSSNEVEQPTNETDELQTLINTIEALEAEVKEAKETAARANPKATTPNAAWSKRPTKPKSLPYKSSPKSY